MKKKVFLAITITVVLLFLLFILIWFCSHDIQIKDATTLEYQNITYVEPPILFGGHGADGQMELDKFVNLPFSNFMRYHSYSGDAPVYIAAGYSSDDFLWVYFREDYDPMTKTYTVFDTNIEFVFSEVFEPVEWNETVAEIKNDQWFSARLADYPELDIGGEMCSVDGTWYLIDSGNMWIVSGDFVQILIQEGVLSADKQN